MYFVKFTVIDPCGCGQCLSTYNIGYAYAEEGPVNFYVVAASNKEVVKGIFEDRKDDGAEILAVEDIA